MCRRAGVVWLVVGVLFFAVIPISGENPRGNEGSGVRETGEGETLESLRNSATAALAAGRYAEGSELYRRWSEREPRRLEAHNGLGRCLLAMGHYDRARGSFLRALQLHPDDELARIGLARTFFAAGNAPEGYRHLADVREKNPSLAALSVALADYYRLQGRNDLRRGYLEKALRSDPQDLEAILELGVLSATEGKVAEAERRLEQAALVAPDAALILRKRGEIHYALSFRGLPGRQLQKARHFYRMYLHAAGDDPSVLSDLVHIEYLLGHAENARDLQERMGDADRDSRPLLTANIAEALLARSPTEASLNMLVESLERACERSVMPLSCFRLEDSLMAHDQNRRFAAQRLERMKRRTEEAKRRVARSRTDAEDLHLARALDLYGEDLNLQKMLLERYRLSGAYEDYLRVLQKVRDAEPQELRWNTRLREALRSRDTYLPYRLGLEESRYARSSVRVLVMDPLPARGAMEHYREPALVASFIEAALRSSSRFEPAPAVVREGVRRRLPGEGDFLRYDTSVPSLLGGIGQTKIGAILEGSYDLRPDRLSLRLQLRDREGVVIASMQEHAAAADVDLLQAATLKFLDQFLELRARMIESEHGLLNVGLADGVHKEELFRSVDDRELIVKVEEASRYVSRTSVVKGRSDRLARDTVFERVVRK